MDWSVVVLLSVFVVLLVLNVPISIAIGVATFGAMLFTIDFAPAAVTVAQRMASGLNSFSLLAIPFFILSGLLMGHGGIARRLIDFAKRSEERRVGKEFRFLFSVVLEQVNALTNYVLLRD